MVKECVQIDSSQKSLQINKQSYCFTESVIFTVDIDKQNYIQSECII